MKYQKRGAVKYFSLIIPTLNEAKNIGPLLAEIRDVVDVHGMEPEIIFVDDGSTDQTRQEIHDYDGPLRVRLICRDHERGLTSAVVKGAHAANHQVVVVMDADLSHSPTMIPVLLKPLEEGSCDMTIGSRYVEGGETPGLSGLRRLGSRVASLGARLFTSVQDPLSGFFAVRREHLLLTPVAGDGFKVALEILGQADNQFRVVEVPLVFKERHHGASKMTFAILSTYFLQLVRLAGKRVNTGELRGIVGLSLIGGLLGCTLFSVFNNVAMGISTSHILSLAIVSHFIWYCSFFCLAGRMKQGVVTGYPSFLMTILLGLFLRGGLFTWLQASPLFGPWLYITVFVTTTLIVSLALLIALNKQSDRQQLSWKQWALLLISYSLLLRLFYLGGPELIQEEAYYWNYSQHMAAGYLDHPPMVALLIKLGTELFGNNEFGVRIGAFSCWFVTAFFTWRFTRLVCDKESAVRGVALLATLPIFFGTALVMTPDAPLIACWAATLYFLYRALVLLQPRAWAGVGLFLGLGMVSKYTIAFLGPAILLFMVIDKPSRKYFLRPYPYLAALLAFVVFCPVVWWNYSNDWASFLFQSRQRLLAGTEFSTHTLLASIVVLLTPTGLLAALSIAWPGRIRASLSRFHTSSFRRGYIFGLLMAIVPLAIITLFSITREVKLNWTGPLWLSVLPFIALTMAGNGSRTGGWINRQWPKTFVVLMVSYGAFLHYSTIGLPGIPYGQGDFLYGWEQFARQVEAEVQEITEQQGRRPLVAGLSKYKIASGLAFYRNKVRPEAGGANVVAETTSRQLFGFNALMYNFWHPPSVAEGRDILVISSKKEWLNAPFYSQRYQDLGVIREFTVYKNGMEAGRYYYRLLIGYTPDGRNKTVTHSPLPVSSHLAAIEKTEKTLERRL